MKPSMPKKEPFFKHVLFLTFPLHKRFFPFSQNLFTVFFRLRKNGEDLFTEMFFKQPKIGSSMTSLPNPLLKALFLRMQ